MSFQKPDYAWLFLAIVVPLLLYLLPMPRRRVMSSMLLLWERFLKAEVVGRTSERFRRAVGFALLAAILAALAAAAAELSLGRPAIVARRLLVLIDASASMNARPVGQIANPPYGNPAGSKGGSGGESNLQRAKTAAIELIESLGARTEVAVAEAAGGLRLVAPFRPAGREAARAVASIEPFDGSSDLASILKESLDLWGGSEDCEIYVFTDAPLPENGWGPRAHIWIAPPAGDNAGIVALSAQRQGKKIVAQFTAANYAAAPQKLSGIISVNGAPRSSFSTALMEPGSNSPQRVSIEEPAAASLVVRLDGPPDALATDDEACIRIPALAELSVRVAWPAGAKHNAYVGAVLGSLQDQGTIGPIAEGDAPLIVWVNQSPQTWSDGGAIVLHPLRGGAMRVAGLHPEPVTVTRQAAHPLLEGVELRGLVVKDAVQVQPPAWAEPIAWAGELPLVWAGQNGNTKALIVAMPLSTGDSQLPLLASFPVLMRNACRWMLPQPQVNRPGEMIDGWTSRRAGLVENPNDHRLYAFSMLNAAESDLRRPAASEEPPATRRRSLAMLFMALALVLLPIEWGLFHRRFTE